jgi:diguanylate cyclase (GGDEF)-like protein/PAS domain S-box-containing protein
VILYRREPQVSGKFMGAVILGSVIAALPYLSMATVRFHPSNLAVDFRYTITRSWLGVLSVTGTALLILMGTVIASTLEGMLESEQAIASAARDAELQFRTLAEAIPQIVWTAGPDGLTTYTNKRWYEMTHAEVGESLGTGWMAAVHPDDRAACQQKWKECLRTGETFEIEYRLHDASKGFRWYLDRAVPLRDASGKIIKWFGTCTDIDDQMHTQQVLEEQIKERSSALFEANLRLQQESIRDPLTGLYNRRYLEETMEREIRRAARAKHSLSVLMLDLDLFKKFNDSYGHDAGDTVLREAASLFIKSVRAEDIVCRYGGEEFVIILPMADIKIAQSRAERIRAKLHNLPVLHHGQSLGAVTVSVGVAALPQHGNSCKELLNAADGALYRAKGEGRDRVVVAQTRAAKTKAERSIRTDAAPKSLG